MDRHSAQTYTYLPSSNRITDLGQFFFFFFLQTLHHPHLAHSLLVSVSNLSSLRTVVPNCQSVMGRCKQ
jgi:hypothetical protein